MKEIINMTPHPITLVSDEGVAEVFLPSGQVARVVEEVAEVGHLERDGYTIPIVEKFMNGVEGLPPEREGVIYIVSAVVLSAAKAAGRTDVLAPDTGPQGALRDKNGRIAGVKRLVR